MIITLRDIVQLSARRSGRTSEIILMCVKFLNREHNKTLIVAVHEYPMVRVITDSINNLIGQYMRVSRHDEIESPAGAKVKVLTSTQLRSSHVLCGLTTDDIVFDTPEIDLFDGSKLLHLISRLDRR
jgi:hypothetical protein